jgi:peroxiredoxin
MNRQISSSASIFIIAGVSILLLVALGLAGRGGPLKGGKRTGQPAPALTGRTTAGRQISLADLKGKVVLLNFWATWCRPCRDELPMLAKLHEKYKDRGLAVLGVADDTPSAVDGFLKADPLPYPTVYGDKAMVQSYGVEAYPTSILIDKNGQIVFDIDGYDPELNFDALVEKYL